MVNHPNRNKRDDQIVPSRWFQGSTGNRLIWSIIKNFDAPGRPLVDGERWLGQFIVPPFQRGLVWTETQKARLIESIYLNMPIGALVVNSTSYGKQCDGWLLDGQQRMTAICGYFADEFPVFGRVYSDLPELDRRLFLRNNIAVVETAINDPVLCRDVYDRLVYGGTPHEPLSQT